jgi:hypothetical protein
MPLISAAENWKEETYASSPFVVKFTDRDGAHIKPTLDVEARSAQSPPCFRLPPPGDDYSDEGKAKSESGRNAHNVGVDVDAKGVQRVSDRRDAQSRGSARCSNLAVVIWIVAVLDNGDTSSSGSSGKKMFDSLREWGVRRAVAGETQGGHRGWLCAAAA